MKYPPLQDLYSFLDGTGRETRDELVLYRGQDCDKPLLPRISRPFPGVNTRTVERKMLDELRRVGGAYLPHNAESDLDLLVRAQHYGMATRLLDWSSNPLVAVWFACCNRDHAKSGYVYFFEPKAKATPTVKEIEEPFNTGRTLIFKPNWNNARIVAQGGWFTLHPYAPSAKRFVPLNENVNQKDRISAHEIKGTDKDDILDELDHLGINHQSLFPDLSGVCKNINWRHNIE